MFVEASKDIWWVGIGAAALTVIVTILTTLNTFLDSNEKESARFTAAHAYGRLNNDARMFWSIERWSANATEELLTAKLQGLVERPQISPGLGMQRRRELRAGEN